jgi:hypothetical protein
MKKTYKTKEETTPEVNEPAPAYNTTSGISANRESAIPSGSMTLDQFGEHFHQKLEDCYEKLSGDC